MTIAKYDAMSLNELRRYALTHREDVEAFHKYIDRSKSEGQMISLDLNDDRWEVKVKERIRYSSKAIRWYCHDKKDDTNSSMIIKWWKELDKKNVIKHHITGMEINKETGIWEPIQINPPVQILLREPNIIVGEQTAFVQYIDRDGLTNQIEAVAIDLDFAKQNLFVWPTSPSEVFIFSFHQ